MKAPRDPRYLLGGLCIGCLIVGTWLTLNTGRGDAAGVAPRGGAVTATSSQALQPSTNDTASTTSSPPSRTTIVVTAPPPAPVVAPEGNNPNDVATRYLIEFSTWNHTDDANTLVQRLQDRGLVTAPFADALRKRGMNELWSLDYKVAQQTKATSHVGKPDAQESPEAPNNATNRYYNSVTEVYWTDPTGRVVSRTNRQETLHLVLDQGQWRVKDNTPAG